MEIQKELLVLGYRNITSEGIILRLSRPAKLKSGNLPSKEFWVSWDKIGEALFQDYSTTTNVSILKELRDRYNAMEKEEKNY